MQTKPQDKEPKPPFPPQKLEKPGLESALEPRPKYRAPEYKPSGKLIGKVAVITGATQASAIVSPCSMRAKAPTSPSPASLLNSLTPTKRNRRSKRRASGASSSRSVEEVPDEEWDRSATKGAIHALTKWLAQLLLEKGIRVNAVAPGPVWTPLNAADTGRTEKEVATFGQHSPIGRPAQPEEVSPAYVFLASDADSRYITGEILNVLGGTTTAG